jgi:hypothetical protein
LPGIELAAGCFEFVANEGVVSGMHRQAQTAHAKKSFTGFFMVMPPFISLLV